MPELEAPADLYERRRLLVVALAEVEADIGRLGVGRSQSAQVGAVVGIEDAAKRLHTTPDALYRKRKQYRLGYLDPLDDKLKFTEAELDDYARKQRRG